MKGRPGRGRPIHDDIDLQIKDARPLRAALEVLRRDPKARVDDFNDERELFWTPIVCEDRWRDDSFREFHNWSVRVGDRSYLEGHSGELVRRALEIDRSIDACAKAYASGINRGSSAVFVQMATLSYRKLRQERPESTEMLLERQRREVNDRAVARIVELQPMAPRSIAPRLNEEKVPHPDGVPWTRNMVLAFADAHDLDHLFPDNHSGGRGMDPDEEQPHWHLRTGLAPKPGDLALARHPQERDTAEERRTKVFRAIRANPGITINKLVEIMKPTRRGRVIEEVKRLVDLKLVDEQPGPRRSRRLYAP